jgi:hypothetical protein
VEKNLIFVGILKATDEKSRIRIRKSVVRIHGSRSVPYQNFTDSLREVKRINILNFRIFKKFYQDPDPDAHYQYGSGCTTLLPGGEVRQAGSQAGGQVGLADETMAAGLQQGFHSLQLDQASLHQLKYKESPLHNIKIGTVVDRGRESFVLCLN